MNLKNNELFTKWGIGLTGNIACGKSSVVDIIEAQGYLVIDADQLSREVKSKGTETYNEIIKTFGQKILGPDMEINRKSLAEIVFKSANERQKLEAIVHPSIQRLSEKKVSMHFKGRKPDFWFYDAALLIETGRYTQFHKVWVVSCDSKIQLARLITRDKLSQHEALARIDSQMDIKKKEALADVVIYNNSDKQTLRKTVLAELQNLENSNS